MAGFFSTKYMVSAVMTGVALALGSCDVIYDDLEPCDGGVKMRFVYDYNLEAANAFPSQVDCLTLHIFDGEGNFVKTITEQSDVLADEDWRMNVDLAPGDYHAITYGGIACDKASFAHDAVPADGTNYKGISMQLLPGMAGTKLHDHFHGAVDFTINGDATDYTPVTIHMSKTTNDVRILLQHLSGEPIDGRDFEFSITDDNTVLDYANIPVAGHPIIYNAWRKGQLSTAGTENPDDAAPASRNDDVRVGYCDFSTSRIRLNTGSHLIIHSNESAKDIVDIPLATYLAMCNNYAYGDSEFLDRCSHYTLTFFLDDNNRWVNVEIRVLGYTVRINNIDI